MPSLANEIDDRPALLPTLQALQRQFRKLATAQTATEQDGPITLSGQSLSIGHLPECRRLARCKPVTQWQVTGNGGTVIVAGIPVLASRIPYYSVHGIGLQSNFILPANGLAAFFKYYDEYSAKARPQGRTFVFGFSWTLRIPKPLPAKP